MSLSALNYPPLVALSGLGLAASIPTIEKLVMNSPLSVIRIANLVAYGISVISVSIPGRMDDEAMDGGELAPVGGKTLVAPSGWAFAIWGPIFLGELVGVIVPFFISEKAPVVTLLKQTSGPFIAAQLFQSLWCATFRPKYKGASRYISTGMLSATAYTLSRAHAAFTTNSARTSYSALEYGILFLPMALHFGWTTAASLVNINGSLSMQEDSSPKVIARVGHLSVVGATALGVFIATTRQAPVFAGVITWALSAVADGMKKRLATASSEGESTPLSGKKGKQSEMGVRLEGASVQYFLSRAGAYVNGLTAVFVAVTMASAGGVKSVAPEF
eukprot:CAMPEP_0198253750 /NCGR_PEP_ID=MMETSP1447-20131203/4134_1 /TAXON_ID=420782 /ORGANISM="Chaetoceros dichaeta, Strain CCMP1751" /LENGTH=330 /DNA_ID=CAMNT_0043939549 /DNA_START=370 /DNA_END=1362 /DNA_ORIENTATION=-